MDGSEHIPCGRYVTAAQLAKERNCHRQTVHNAIHKTGAIPLDAVVHLGEVVIIREDVAERWHPQKAAGRPRKANPDAP